MQRLALLLAFCLISQTGYAQQSQVSFGLIHDVNRYRWDAGVEVDETFNQWSATVTNRFRSDAYVLFDDVLTFRDENQTRLRFARRLSSTMSAFSAIDADWFSLSRVLQQQSLVGIEYRAKRDWRIVPQIGFAVDQRPGVRLSEQEAPLRIDAGPAAAIDFDYNSNAANPNNTIRASTRASMRRIQPRRGREVVASLRGTRSIGSANYTSDVIFSSYRRDTYEPVSFLNRDAAALAESIESTTSDTFRIALAGSGQLAERLFLSGETNFTANNRLVRNRGALPTDALFFATDFKRRSFDASVTLRSELARATSYLTANFGAEQEDRSLANQADLPPVQAIQRIAQLRQADYDRGIFGLTGGTTVRFGRVVTVGSVAATILRHDTPEENPDDRDELIYIGRFGVQVPISPELTTTVNIFGSRYETVYLKSSRSAENNVQRSLRLRPAVEWSPSRRTTFRFGSEVRATYTEDQFVLPGRRSRDQSAREFRMDVAVERYLTDQTRVSGQASHSTLHLGRFLADQFAEIPFDTLDTTTGNLQVSVGKNVQSTVGLRLLNRSDYSPALTLRYSRPTDTGNVPATITRPGREVIRQLGPTSSISWSMRRRSLLRVDGWLAFQRVSQRLYGILPETDAQLIRTSGRKGTRKTIPNLSLTVVWYF